MIVRKTLLLILLGFGIFVGFRRAVEGLLLAVSTVSNSKSDLLEKSTHSITYTLNDDSWAVYDIPANHGVIKVITNACCKKTDATQNAKEIGYALQYRLLGDGGSILKDGEYRFRSKIQQKHVLENGQTGSRLFFIGGGSIAAESRLALLSFPGLGNGPKELHLKAHEPDELVDCVLARIYLQTQLSAAKQAYRWKRLKKSQKQHLARFNVYPQDLLSDTEVERYCAFEWNALAPRGVVGRDYKTKILYMRKSLGVQGDVEATFKGSVANEKQRIVFSIPEGRHAVAVRLERKAEPESEERPIQALCTWHDELSSKYARTRFTVGRDPCEKTLWLKNGLLEVAVEENTVVRAFLMRGRSEEEIKPKEAYVRTYICNKGQSVSFKIRQIESKTTSFRFDFRWIIKPSDAADAESTTAVFELLDKNGTVIQRGEVIGDREQDFFSKAVGGEQDEYISVPTKRYFAFSGEYEEIRVRSKDSKLLIVAYNRIATAEKQLNIPEDRYAYNRSRSKRRNWYALRPKEYGELLQSRRTCTVLLQHKPRIYENDRSSFEAEWQRFRPGKTWKGCQLLVKDTSEGESKNERQTARHIYSELPVNSENYYAFGNLDETELESKILVMHGDRETAGVCVELNRSPLQQLILEKSRGMSSIPNIQVGEHMVSISGESGSRVFMNNMVETAQPSYKRTIATAISNGAVRVTYCKNVAGCVKILSRFFIKGSERERLDLCVSIRPFSKIEIGPHTSYSYLKYKFSIRPNEGSGVYSINERFEKLLDYPGIVIALKSDLLPGIYDLEYDFNFPVKGYFTLSTCID